MNRNFFLLILFASATAFGGTWWYLGQTTDKNAAVREPSRENVLVKQGDHVEYSDCGEVIASGNAPLLTGRPGYKAELDPDGDGIACPPPA